MNCLNIDQSVPDVPPLANLPESAQKLIALIGLMPTLRLIDAHGGTIVNLYHSETSLERMSKTVGRDAAATLLKFFGNDPFTVPNCHRAIRLFRNAGILAEFDQLTLREGLSARASVLRITRRLHLHERQVWRILKTTGTETKEVDPRQMSLI
ncbi:hypothetical protein [Undibacterium sp. Ren11W]|uniref:hypothetical protein n=1 Tax=Undibacterium sp. Ren11W TaxID=3413045 RepID=UPI003BF428F8